MATAVSDCKEQKIEGGPSLSDEQVEETQEIENRDNSPGSANDSGGQEKEAACPFLDQETLEKLSLGLLQNLLPDFQKAQASLAELTENQRILIETIQQENKKFGECQALTDVTDSMDKAKLYHSKLISIKKDMIQLHEKSAKLKKRALRLQQQKQKEALELEQKREQELERERQLTAKPARRSHSEST